MIKKTFGIFLILFIFFGNTLPVLAANIGEEEFLYKLSNSTGTFTENQYLYIKTNSYIKKDKQAVDIEEAYTFVHDFNNQTFNDEILSNIKNSNNLKKKKVNLNSLKSSIGSDTLKHYVFVGEYYIDENTYQKEYYKSNLKESNSNNQNFDSDDTSDVAIDEWKGCNSIPSETMNIIKYSLWAISILGILLTVVLTVTEIVGYLMNESEQNQKKLLNKLIKRLLALGLLILAPLIATFILEVVINDVLNLGINQCEIPK